MLKNVWYNNENFMNEPRPATRSALPLLIFLFISIPQFAFAAQPSSALDNAPSVDATAKQSPSSPPVPSAGVRKPNSDEEPAEEGQSSYVYDLKKLIIKSRENIKRVN